ncbi:uncharacterized protein LOC113655445 isoform X2 [Tachysurus fulvidraco]|uniref:uncharacterized protein LOC113655445 isoform X2 n=1 Tax=Tachysurus fulvidraco TaxID=1234273 RepID=UPI001FED9400|nr:uncharacterized protein LOC113655445 isoform X2 [Tachysurus fulvidraco]
MSQSCVHLVSLVLVVVLCICMVTSVSATTNTTDSLTSVPFPNDDDTEDFLNSLNTTRQQDEFPVNITTNPDTPTEPSTTVEYSSQKEAAVTGSTPKVTQKTGSTPKVTQKTGSTITGSTTKGSTTIGSPTKDSGGGAKAAGIFFLIFIIFLIFILLMILYCIWKKGKRYSFDLKYGEHDTPLQFIDTTGTFEQTKGSTMNLDYIMEENPNKTTQVANGCSGETPDQTSTSEQQNVPEDDSFTSDLGLMSPVKKVDFNLDLDLISADPETEKQTTEETTDKGNDSADLFTEINLDDMQ